MKKIGYILLFVVAIFGCTSTQEETTQVLERSTPEAEGVSSQGIIDFLNGMNAEGLEAHSFMFLRHGKVIAEGWWKPYGPEFTHLMYSASKSVTSLAIGIAIDEGRLQVTDKVISFFPEYMTDSISENMKLLTVKDLLTMSVGQAVDPAYVYQRGPEDWIWGFLHTEPVHTPGTVMMYNNFATFMLSAIIQKVTGQKLFNYLEPRLFDPLAIKNIEWDFNDMGINQGMIGSHLHTEDLAKLGQLALQKGRWGNKQIVSAAYIEEAGKFQITTNNEGKPEEELNDGEKGYGYQYWRGSHNSFRMDGMGGQLVIVMPDYDAVIVVTSNVNSSNDEMEQMWKYLVPAMSDEVLPANPELNQKLDETLESLTWLPKPGADISSDLIAAISGEKVAMDENRMGIKGLSFTFVDDKCNIAIEKEESTTNIVAGIGEWDYALIKAASLSGSGSGVSPFRRSSNEVNRDMRNMKHVASTIGAKDENTLVLTARFVEESLGAESWELEFVQSGNTTEVKLNPGGGRRMFGPPGEPTILTGKVVK
ncbi:MAG TPA: serine hydrolase [Draconibacterium sp.]|nr:serine hydrolase [Draconibacterium sp.]